MKKIESIDQIQIGSVVYSTNGRDCGSYFMVVSVVDKQFVLISDGDKHRLNHPKRKSIKHLKEQGAVLDIVALKLKDGRKVYDSELKSNLREYNNSLIENNGGQNV